MTNHDNYKIVTENNSSAQQKKNNWEMAIGLNQVDGLVPSEYLACLVQESIEGRKSYRQVEDALVTYYHEQDFSKLEIQNMHECDIVSTRIAEILEDQSFVFSPIYLKSIHERLFKGVFVGALKEYAGRFRDYNITKDEPILGGSTVIYGNFGNIMDYLKYDFDEEKDFDYSKLDLEKQIMRVSKFTSSIWQVHPFGEGNTRTTAVFNEKYLRNMGWNINNDLFKENSLYFRNALVLSNYADIKNGISPNFKYLLAFFHKLLDNADLSLPEMKSAIL